MEHFYDENPALASNGVAGIDDPVRSRLSKATLDFLDDIRIDDATTGAVVEEQPSVLRIQRPKQSSFWMTLPGFRIPVTLYVEKEEGKAGTAYVVGKRMVDHEALPALAKGIAVISAFKTGHMFVQLVRLPDPADPHPAHVTMLAAIETSQDRWVRVVWSKPRNEYRVFPGQTGDAVNWEQLLGETPEIRAARATELFVQAVRHAGRYIDGPDHPIMMALLDITAAPEASDPLA
jgi:hypothetical protein